MRLSLPPAALIACLDAENSSSGSDVTLASWLKALRDTNIYISEASRALWKNQLVSLRTERWDTVSQCVMLFCVSLHPAIYFVYKLSDCLRTVFLVTNLWSRYGDFYRSVPYTSVMSLLVVFTCVGYLHWHFSTQLLWVLTPLTVTR